MAEPPAVKSGRCVGGAPRPLLKRPEIVRKLWCIVSPGKPLPFTEKKVGTWHRWALVGRSGGKRGGLPGGGE